MLIRKYQKSDRAQVEMINFETGFFGKSMSNFISNQTLWNNLVSYYLEKEPESAFVVENKGKVVGYLLGTTGKKRFHLVSYYIKTFFKTLFALHKLRPKDLLYFGGKFIYLFNTLIGRYGRQRIKTPKHAGHFHIDILPGFRGKKTGTKLLNEFLKYAKNKGVKTIYADSYETPLNPNTNFWLKNEFKEFDRIRTYVWADQLPDEKIYLVCFVKELR